MCPREQMHSIIKKDLTPDLLWDEVLTISGGADRDRTDGLLNAQSSKSNSKSRGVIICVPLNFLNFSKSESPVTR